jgi:hypothetical protein
VSGWSSSPIHADLHSKSFVNILLKNGEARYWTGLFEAQNVFKGKF